MGGSGCAEEGRFDGMEFDAGLGIDRCSVKDLTSVHEWKRMPCPSTESVHGAAVIERERTREGSLMISACFCDCHLLELP